MLLFHSAGAEKIHILFTALLEISLGLLASFIKLALVFSIHQFCILKAEVAVFPCSITVLRTLMRVKCANATVQNVTKKTPTPPTSF